MSPVLGPGLFLLEGNDRLEAGWVGCCSSSRDERVPAQTSLPRPVRYVWVLDPEHPERGKGMVGITLSDTKESGFKVGLDAKQSS